MTLSKLRTAEKVFHLHRLRDARYNALKDAEDFTSICFALEELGCRLKGSRAMGFGGYEKQYRGLSVLGGMDPGRFAILFDQVRVARNDAAHQGVFARNAARRAIRLCIYIEEILLNELELVGDVMSSGLQMAEPYHTLSHLRELMLSSSFSFLPYRVLEEYLLVSDLFIAKLLRSAEFGGSKFYSVTLAQIGPEGINSLERAEVLGETDPLTGVMDRISVYPAVVQNASAHPVGIISAFDLL